MSDIINILPDSVANQIAAGEVVERPASAVKEMLENAMDAGATAIELIVKDAGRTLIQVIDNGCGMSDSDARLCFERHATSKIHKADDLFAIRTMGFRGEALAAIAAVSQVELRTRQHDSELGTEVQVEGSDVKEQCPCNCAPGTSIAVKNLFFNIPARRNFLKKDSIELSHIEEIFRRVALANCDKDFAFHHNGRLLYDLKASNLAQRIAGLFGNNYKERLFHVHEETDIVRIDGYIGKAEYAKRTRGEQYLFVNNRFIKHIGLSSAIEKAYAELIPERTYPSYFVMLEVDPSKIDVNIHPTKTEVKFTDESVIYAILRAATKKALGQFSLATELEFNPSTEFDFAPAPKDYTPQPPKVSYNSNYNPFASQSETRFDSFSSKKSPSRHEFEHFFDDTDKPSARSEECASTPSLIPNAEHATGTTQKTSEMPLSYLGRYIVSTLKSGILIIDQQRAHERIIYERLMLRMEQSQAAAQQLLFPVNCRFNAGDSEVLMEMFPELKQLGFAIEPLGQNTFVVTATPVDITDNDIQSLLEQAISDYKGSMMQKFSDRKQSLCAALARQTAVKAGATLYPQEMQQLIADLFSCQVPHTAPSGKRTMFILNEQELAERFK
ncbi:MAG: DNA mismatch repair endonuclease MutL [Bacteroidales bacterium]|nr:DNA mismatch repair endonuclease MutL [Bacteroidales bacterium]